MFTFNRLAKLPYSILLYSVRCNRCNYLRFKLDSRIQDRQGDQFHFAEINDFVFNLGRDSK